MKRIVVFVLIVILAAAMSISVGAVRDMTFSDLGSGVAAKWFSVKDAREKAFSAYPYIAVFYGTLSDGREGFYCFLNDSKAITGLDKLGCIYYFSASEGGYSPSKLVTFKLSVVDGNLQMQVFNNIGSLSYTFVKLYYIENFSTASLSGYDSLAPSYDWIVHVVEPPPEESSKPSVPPVIGDYVVPQHMLDAVGSGDVLNVVSSFAGPFLNHAMSAVPVVIGLFGVLIAIKVIPKIFRFFFR